MWNKSLAVVMAFACCILALNDAWEIKEGEWRLDRAQVKSDVCGMANFQDVSDFVPSNLVVKNATEVGFELENGGYCDWTNSTNFACSPTQLREKALRGTYLIITTKLSGVSVQGGPGLMYVMMDVVIERCRGSFCSLMEAVLDFPCPMELGAGGVKK